jgi:hypothetical protein
MCAKMPIVIESVGDQGQRVEQGFEWPDGRCHANQIWPA